MLSPTSTVTINRPVDEVFDFVARGYVENHPRWDDGCVSSKKTSDGPLDVGSTGVEERRDGGRPATYDFRVTVFEESRSMAIEAESKEAHFSMSYTFESRGGETVVTTAPRMRMKGLGRFIEPLIAGNFRRQLDERVAEMKRLAES